MTSSDTEKQDKKLHSFYVHLVSDATGTTLQSLARAALAQFKRIDPQERYWPLIRTDRQLNRVLEDITKHPGPVLFTFVDEEKRKVLRKHCTKLDVPCIAVMDPLLKALAAYTGLSVQGVPGLQHVMNDDYFKRVDAIDFALGFDDGQHIKGLEEADVVLVGVSRTSKTPTCIFLARRGIKAGNIPLVPHVDFPDRLLNLENPPLFVGLTESPDRLIQLRSSRLRIGEQKENLYENQYLDPEAVEDEVKKARKLFKENKWPIIDVTRRSVEETSAEIMVLLQKKRSADKKKLAEAEGK
ncbi:MAG: kinase/pyrophosphorylase [Alphaproteobacteria bacterium]|nr:kinase/pyrophosphorylase [Alphaproteobacteria bacterium]